MRLQACRLLAVDVRWHAPIQKDKLERSSRATTFLDCSYRSGSLVDKGRIESGRIDGRDIRLVPSEKRDGPPKRSAPSLSKPVRRMPRPSWWRKESRSGHLQLDSPRELTLPRVPKTHWLPVNCQRRGGKNFRRSRPRWCGLQWAFPAGEARSLRRNSADYQRLHLGD